jgi:diguanylate cyclase (GGDEF)-like protein
MASELLPTITLAPAIASAQETAFRGEGDPSGGHAGPKIATGSSSLCLFTRSASGRSARFLFSICLVPMLALAVSAKSFAQGVSFLSSGNVERLADLDFDSLNTRDSLPHRSVYDVAQDTTGYIWIATYGGLSRFDGYQLRTYTHDPVRPDSLRDNNVRVLLPAGNGDLWIGSDTAGVFYYRAALDAFEDLPNIPSFLKGGRIYCMISDGQGGIWVGGQFGLVRYDAHNKTYESFQPSTGSDDDAGTADRSRFTLKRVFSLFLDKNRTLWVGGDAGLLRLKAGSGQFEPVQGVNGKHEVGARPFVWSFLQDHVGRLWVGCDHVGVAIYDPTAHILRGVPGLSGASSEIGEHTVRGLLEHAPGKLWIATYGGGLVTYDSSSGFIRTFIKGDPTPSPLKNNFLRGIFKDRSGVVWVATENGLARINDASSGIFQIHPSLLNPEKLAGTEVRSVSVVNGQIWIGFDQGEFGPIDRDGHVSKIKSAPGVPASLVTKREIFAIIAVDSNTVYAGGTGLFRADLRTRTYRPSLDPLISLEVVSSLCADGGRLWAGTYTGLYRYDLRTGQSHMYRHDPTDPNSLSENDVREILRTHDGLLWISTRAGLDMRDPATGKFRAFHHIAGDSTTLPGDNVRAMAEDNLGRLWVGTTDAGLAILLRYTPDGKPVFRTLDTRTGLPSDSILSVTRGKDGRIWANTSGGLSVIQPDTLAIETYTAGDGLPSASQKLFGSVTLDDGTLLFRGADGLIAIEPNHLEQRTYRAPLVMTELQSLGDPRTITTSAYRAMRSPIHLSPYHRGFEAQFSLLDYTRSEDTRYSYFLKGVDTRWIEAPAGAPTITYSELPSGQLTLLVRAASRFGQGSTEESAFQIDAPQAWDETLAFCILLASVAGFLVYLLIRARTGVLERRREYLELVIAQRTTQLDEQRQQLEKANLLLNQLAIRDPLTNLYNRRHFFDLAEAEFLRSRRSGRICSLLLMDIDHFKLVNDTHGHLTGDAVIQQVSALVLGSMRATDTVARFGGEEYIVLLPETNRAQALQLAERIRTSIASAPLHLVDKTIAVTLSIGCAQIDADRTLNQFMERTDKALYTAKAEGRDRVVVA